MKRLSQAIAWLMLCLSFPVFAAPPSSVQASYDVYRDGMKIGRMDETYTRQQDHYTLTSITTPLGLLALFKPEKVIVSSNGLISKQGLQPQQFSHRRERDASKDSSAEFDWDTRQLTLVHQAQRTVVGLPDGTQDRLSAMYQFMFLPLQAGATLDFSMTNGIKLDNYHYAITQQQKLKTPVGEFNTLYLDSQAKPGETRTEIWLATQSHNLPCQMIITNPDGEQLTQVLSKLQIR